MRACGWPGCRKGEGLGIRAADVAPVIAELQAAGAASLRAIADAQMIAVVRRMAAKRRGGALSLAGRLQCAAALASAGGSWHGLASRSSCARSKTPARRRWPALGRSPCLVQLTDVRQDSRQIEMRNGVISVGFKAPRGSNLRQDAALP
jgi:hypothetical protein